MIKRLSTMSDRELTRAYLTSTDTASTVTYAREADRRNLALPPRAWGAVWGARNVIGRA